MHNNCKLRPCLHSQDEAHRSPGQTLALCGQLRRTELLQSCFDPICVTALLEGHRRASQPLTITDDFQGGQEVLVTDDRHGHEHVDNNEEVDYYASVRALLPREEPCRKLRCWGGRTLRAVFYEGRKRRRSQDVGVTHLKSTKTEVGLLVGIWRSWWECEV